ncbi:MAG: c-type cytochrome [Gammaproteobacteria bacterium]
MIEGTKEMVESNTTNTTLFRLILVILCVGGLLVAPVSFAENAEDGEEMSFTFEEKLQSCAACHGENGDKPLAPEYPILAGQHPDYIAQALRQYKSGRRTNPIMMQQVELLELTDADMVRLGQYFGAKPGLKSLTK